MMRNEKLDRRDLPSFIGRTFAIVLVPPYGLAASGI
jgi:hypothetical protein